MIILQQTTKPIQGFELILIRLYFYLSKKIIFYCFNVRINSIVIENNVGNCFIRNCQYVYS